MDRDLFSKNRDSDNDGIPDVLEETKYNTDPFKPNYLLYYALQKLPEEDAIRFKDVSYNESSKGLVDLLASLLTEKTSLDLDLALDLIVLDKTVNESERILFAESFLNPGSVEVSTSFLVGASYMTFWKMENYGNWALTQYHPILGQYRSNDPAIASNHIRQAREHGIRFFYLDFGWIRPGSRCDLAAQNGLLSSPNIHLINFFMFYFPDAVTGQDWSIGETALFSDFEYMATHYMSHPQYLRIEGRAVVVIVNLPDYWRAYGVSGTNELFLGLKEVMMEKYELDLFIIGGVWPDSSADFLETGPRVFDGVTVWGNLWDSLGNKAITSYDEYAERYVGIWKSWHKICEGEGISFVPLAKPGFNNTPYLRFGQELRVITRDVKRFQLLLGEARNLSSRPLNMVLIFTWNDFNEGTSIEPTIEYGFSYMEAVQLVFAQEEEYVEIQNP